jgi:YidC/Oxa1 family membrane protein insertase
MPVIAANILQPLIDVCDAVLQFWHDDVGFGWGASIIMLTVCVRLFILPLTFKQVKSIQAMQVHMPELKRIQERYKDDRQRMNQEVMRFYQENKVNPLASCLPLLLQLPFFISLFYLLRADKFERDVAGEESFLFIPDLAEKVTDPVILGVLIVLYVGTQLAASAVTAISADKTQQRIMFALPFVFVFFIITFQAGLIVYWITTNVWTVGQQLLVKKLYPKPELPADGKDDGDGRKPARRKPAATARAADGKPARAKAALEASSLPAQEEEAVRPAAVAPGYERFGTGGRGPTRRGPRRGGRGQQCRGGEVGCDQAPRVALPRGHGGVRSLRGPRRVCRDRARPGRGGCRGVARGRDPDSRGSRRAGSCGGDAHRPRAWLERERGYRGDRRGDPRERQRRRPRASDRQAWCDDRRRSTPGGPGRVPGERGTQADRR